MARPAVRNERWLVAGAAALVLAGGITYVVTAGPATAEHSAVRLASKPVPPAVVTVTPADGAAKIAPDTQVQITASGGTLTQVTVASGDSAVTGQYGPGSTSWSTGWGLKPATSYTVTAVARNSKGAVTTEVTHFTTTSAARILQVSSITPGSGETAGVGMPIIVDFNYDVARSDRPSVEHALEVGSDVPVTGAWFWASGSEVVFRTQSYWPAREHVLLTAHLTGVPGGPGLWGDSDLSHSFTIGDSHVVKVNLKTDWAHFYTNGSLARTIPVSGGMGGYDSFGNDFYTTGGAAWWRHTAYRGDPVTITGTPRLLAWDNGWGYWQQSWSAWLKDSSAGAVTTTTLGAVQTQGAGIRPP